MRLFPMSKKRRVIKKWFRRTGYIKGIYIGRKHNLYCYKIKLPIGKHLELHEVGTLKRDRYFEYLPTSYGEYLTSSTPDPK
jgi:ribosomal protein S8